MKNNLVKNISIILFLTLLAALYFFATNQNEFVKRYNNKIMHYNQIMGVHNEIVRRFKLIDFIGQYRLSEKDKEEIIEKYSPMIAMVLSELDIFEKFINENINKVGEHSEILKRITVVRAEAKLLQSKLESLAPKKLTLLERSQLLISKVESSKIESRQRIERLKREKVEAEAKAERERLARIEAEKRHHKTSKVFRDTLKDGSQGPEMVRIPAGSFRMGDIQGGGYFTEKPVHKVSISAFAMGRYEVTFAEYDKFAKATGKNKPDDWGWGRGNRPVINVSWNEATAYAKWLSQQTGHKYRLPTEAEWEYAARAGTTTKYWWGNKIGSNKANCDSDCGDRFKYTAPVGSFAANPFHIYDTVGNVWEWCSDRYGDNYYSRSPRSNPKGPSTGRDRVLRGGAWSKSARHARAGGRVNAPPWGRIDSIGSLGFRLLRQPSKAERHTEQEARDQAEIARLKREKARVDAKKAERERQARLAAEKRRKKTSKVFRDSLNSGGKGPEMVRIPAGSFRMGDIQGGGYSDEQPVHRVSVGAFSIGKFEVTVGDFRQFVKATRYKTDAEKQGTCWTSWNKQKGANWRNPSFSQNNNHPVTCVSWNDATAYAKWLSQQTGYIYRLPTEAEWEYAARAGTSTKYWWDNNIGSNRTNCDDDCGDSFNYTAPVGSFAANQFGIYDTVGNVSEWCADIYSKNYYKNSPPNNPKGPTSTTGLFRVLRGGAWIYLAKYVRAARRHSNTPDFRTGHNGFRLLRQPSKAERHTEQEARDQAERARLKREKAEAEKAERERQARLAAEKRRKKTSEVFRDTLSSGGKGPEEKSKSTNIKD